MKKTTFCIALLSGIFSNAQEIKTDKNIQEVTILGRKKIKQERKEFSRHGQSVETLSEEELNRNNPSMIEQTLSTMAGVQVDKRTNLGGQRIIVRGYGNDQKFNNWGVKFYWNNIPLTNAEGVTLLDDVDFAYVNNIEVIKGPASTLYGGGTGGTVRLYTRPDFVKKNSISENLLAGSFKTLQSRTEVSSSDENYSINAAYGHLETDGYRAHGSSLKNFFNVNGTVKLSKINQISFFGSQAYSNEHISGQIPYEDYYRGIDNGNPAYIRKNAHNEMKSTRVGITNSIDLTSNFRNNTTLFYYNLNQESVSAGAYGITASPNVGIRSTFTLKNKIKGDFENQLDFGTEIQNSTSTTSSYRFTGSVTNPLETTGIAGASYFKYNNNQASYFAINHITYKPLAITLLTGISINNTQYDRKDLFALPNLVTGHTADLSFAKKFKTTYSPHIALQKEWKNQIFNLSYSTGYNAPTASAAFIGGKINMVNDDLKPEKAKMWDFSIHGLLANTKLDYQVSFFRTQFYDKLSQDITKDSNGNNVSYWKNTGNQKNTGFEASIGYLHTNETGFFNKILPFLNLSYYDAKYTHFIDKSPEDTLPQDYSHKSVVGIPRNKFTTGIDLYTKPGVYLNTTYNYLGQVYTNYSNGNLVKGFGLLNAKIGYKTKISKLDLDAYLIGNNLTNQIHYTFLFLGNNVKDGDAGSGYTTPTDLNPGPKKAYFFGGLNIKYNF